MSGFLAVGGRIAFMGEHGTFAPTQNNNITSAVTALGRSMSIVNTILDSGFQDATRLDGQILDHALTTGVKEALMLGADQTSVIMGYQNVGPGSIFIITDQNVWDNVSSTSNDNAVMFENLIAGVTGAPPPPPVDGEVPEPSSYALMASGVGALIASSRRRRAAQQ